MKSYSPLQHPDAVSRILAQISFLGGLGEEQLARLMPRFESASFEKGEFIARKEEEPSHIYIIQRGRVELWITGKEGTFHKREFQVGDSFGEVALLSLVNNTASFVAAEDCDLIVLSRKTLARIQREDPDIFSMLVLNIARDLARKLQFTDELLVRLEGGQRK